MIAEGVPLTNEDPGLLGNAKRMAGAAWIAGPEPWNEATLAQQRFALTDLADAFAITFELFFSAGDAAPPQALIDRILAPSGGRLRSGFRQQAPADWRTDVACNYEQIP